MFSGRTALFVLVCTLAVGRVAADVCTSTPKQLFFAEGAKDSQIISGANWFSCQDSVNFLTTAERNAATALLTAAQTAFELHSFTDLSKNYAQDDPPFTIQTDVLAQIGVMKGKVDSYTNMFQLFDELSTAIGSLMDDHAQFIRPNPLNNWYQVAPWGLMIELTSGTAPTPYVKTVPGYIPLSNFTDAFSLALDSNYMGKTVTHINGVPALQFLEEFALLNGTQYRDRMTRLNALLGPNGRWAVRPMQTLPAVFRNGVTYTLDMSGTSTDVSVVHGFIGFAAIASSDGLRNTIMTGVAKKRSASEVSQNKISTDLPFSAISSSSASTRTKRAGYTLSTRQAELTAGEIIFAEYNFGPTQAAVLRLPTFALGNINLYNKWIESMNSVITAAKQQGNKNLIIDVCNNKGGAAVLAQLTAAMLVGPWDGLNNATSTTFDHPFQVFDMPLPTNSKWKALADAGLFANAGNQGVWPYGAFKSLTADAMFTPSDWYNNRNTFVQNGASRSLSGPGLYYGASDLSFVANQRYTGQPAPKYFFEKIIIVSNGICGSTCAQFVNLMRGSDRVRTIFIGGSSQFSSDPVSYPGGSRFEYNTLRGFADQVGAISQLPAPGFSGSDFLLNAFESYHSCAAYLKGEAPADMKLKKADAQLNKFWQYAANPLRLLTTADPTEVANAEALYTDILPFFDRMPANLTIMTRSRVAAASIAGISNALCADNEPFYPITPFSYDCYGVWDNVTACTKPCNSGNLTQRYRIVVKGTTGTGCSNVAGDERIVSCNPNACGCMQETRRTSLCNEQCKWSTVVRDLPESVGCNTTDGTIGTGTCSGENCLPELTKFTSLKRGPVVPIYHCSVINPVTSTRTVYFGYQTIYNNIVNMPVTATENIITGTSKKDHGQPSMFKAGLWPFQLKLEGVPNTDITWTVDSPVTAPTDFEPGSCAALDTSDVTVRLHIQAPTRPMASPLQDCMLIWTGLSSGSGRVSVVVSDAPTAENVFIASVTISNPNAASPSNVEALWSFGQKMATFSDYGAILGGLKACAVSDATGVYIELDSQVMNSAANPGLISITLPPPPVHSPSAASSLFSAGVAGVALVASLVALLL